MLVGGAGSGKTVLVGNKLSLLPESFAVANVPFNFYTTSGKFHHAYFTGTRLVCDSAYIVGRITLVRLDLVKLC